MKRKKVPFGWVSFPRIKQPKLNQEVERVRKGLDKFLNAIFRPSHKTKNLSMILSIPRHVPKGKERQYARRRIREMCDGI